MKVKRKGRSGISPSGRWSWNWFRQTSETESSWRSQPGRQWYQYQKGEENIRHRSCGGGVEGGGGGTKFLLHHLNHLP